MTELSWTDIAKNMSAAVFSLVVIYWLINIINKLIDRMK